MTETAETVSRSCSLAGRRVLVVEDNPATRLLYGLVIERAGGEAAGVRLGPEAIRAAIGSDEPFDAVLVGLRRGGASGRETAAELRARGYTGAVLAVAEQWSPELADRLLSRGFDECLPKPVAAGELVGGLVRALFGFAVVG